MNAMTAAMLFLLGLILTVKGGDLFVDAASWLAEVSGLPKFLIGATIVSMATTLPELLVSMMASAGGRTGIAVGNAVGSVTANIGLIMGISLVCLPTLLQRGQEVNLLIMLSAIALLIAASLSGRLSLTGAWLLLALFAAYTFLSIRAARRHLGTDAAHPDRRPKVLLANGVKFLLGAAGIIGGAQLMVDQGCALARLLGVPESIIGATLVAVGTSLPELITTLTALVKRQPALSIGNILGANILDLTVILPLCAVVSGRPLPMLEQNLHLDMPACLILVITAVLPPLITQRFHRAQGAAMLLGYGAYVTVMCARFI